MKSPSRHCAETCLVRCVALIPSLVDHGWMLSWNGHRYRGQCRSNSERL